MAITGIEEIIKKEDTITIQNKQFKVRKLNVDEREQYNDLKQSGFGVVQAGIGGARENKANLNMQKVNHADYEANKFLIKASFTYDDNVCTDEDVNGLYDLFDDFVEELRRVNKLDITEEEADLLENDIKKQ